MSPGGDELDARTVEETVAQIEAALAAAAGLVPVDGPPPEPPCAGLGRGRLRSLGWVLAACLVLALAVTVAYWIR